MVFVPAVMSAGLVFSVSTALRDLLHRGSGIVIARDARLRGVLVADAVLDGSAARDAVAERTEVAPRWVLFLTGAGAATFAVYLAIGATANYFRRGDYVSSIVWLWSASMLVVLGALVFAAAALAAAWRHPATPPWGWWILRVTPLVDLDRRDRGRDRMRWSAIVAVSVFTLLSVLATWPRVLEPIDRPFEELVDVSTRTIDAGQVFGTTQLSVVLAVVIGVATTRCRLFARLFIMAIVVALGTTNLVRHLVDRPRPNGGTGSFPSGHAVQATLLFVLVPLAVREILRRRWIERIVRVVLLVGLVLLGARLVASGHHAPTDVIGGLLLGGAIAGWVRSVVTDPTVHGRCTECVFGRSPT